MRNSPVLSEPDRRAVDLLLNHAATVSPGSRCESLTHRRIDAVRKVLSKLDHMPPVEPPAGMVRRTLERIERQAVMPVSAAAAIPEAAFH